MNKKISLILVIIALCILAAFPLFWGGSVSDGGKPISSDEADEIIASRTLDAELVSELYFGDQKLCYDSANNLYLYSLPEGTDSGLKPSIKAVSKSGSLRAALVDSSISYDMIGSNGSIPILFYNDKYYFTSEVKCTTLPVMDISCGGEIGDEYTDMSMSLFDNRKEAVKQLTVSDGQIRKRGGITSDFPKFPMRFKLYYHSPGDSKRGYHTSLLGMDENNSWILYPAYNDEDRVRNVFSQNLWYDTVGKNNAFKVPTGPQYKYLEVFIDDEYMGLYALGYTIDESSVNIDSNDDEQGLFKKVLDTRYDLLEMRDRNEDAVRGYRLITDEKDPQKGISGKWRSLVDYFLYLDENAGDSKALLDVTDIDNAMDFAIYTDMIQGDDSVYKNFYVAIKKDDLGRKKILLCPWDLDASWGNEFIESEKNRFAQYSHSADYNFFMEDTYLEQILVNADTDTLDKYIERYRELRSSLWSDENITAVLDDYEKDIFSSGAIYREIERWPGANNPADPTNGLSRFKSYVCQRLSEYDSYFDRLEEVKTEPALVRRTASCKYFDNADYLMCIKDRSILEDEEYMSFMEETCHVDPAQITDDISYIVYLRDKDKTYYLPDPGGAGNAYGCEDFTLTLDEYEDADYFFFYGDEAYTAFLNGVPCYDTSDEINEKLILSAICDGKAQKINTALGYQLEIDESVYEFYELR
ncbi:MAG: CotH kinase family protein [Butyrivibrio sp.]|nr:CotH kinase family protein [Butyrivibrio sp.]